MRSNARVTRRHPWLGLSLAAAVAAGPTGVMSAMAATQALDLSSSAASIAIPSSVHSPTTILVGGNKMTLSAGQLVTPAEFMALQGVLRSGTQSLVLDSAGRAVGGTFTAPTGSALGSLLIPSGVTGLGHGVLDITGAFTDQGRMVGIGSLLVRNFSLDAGSINVASGGLLTTIIPSDLASTIRYNGPTNLSLFSNSGNVTNHGTISSSANVLINTFNSNALVVDNTGGQISAVGNISLRSAGYSLKNATSLSGGTLSATNVNFNAGNGTLNVNADQIDGVVNVTAGISNVVVQQGTLNVGKNDISGDPVYASTTGSVNLTSNILAAGDFAILAHTDVTANDGVTSIKLTGGGTLTILAGVDFGASSPDVVPPAVPGSGTYIVNDFNNGGSVSLPHVNVDTSTTVANRNAGNVIIVGSKAGTSNGDVQIGAIKTSATTGHGGFVNIAGNHISTFGSIDTHATGSTANGGAVDIESHGAAITGPVTFTNGTPDNSISVSGAPPLYTGGTILIGDQIKNNGTITTSGGSHGGSVTIVADGQVDVSNSITTSGTKIQSGAVSLHSSSDSVVVNGQILEKSNFDSPGLSITAGNNVEVAKGITTTGSSGAGSISIDATNLVNIGFNLTSVNPLALTAQGGISAGGGSATTGGTVNINSTTGDVRIGTGINTSASVQGGAISITSGDLIRSDGNITSAGGTNGKAGAITLTSTGGDELKGIEVKGNVTANGSTGAAITISGNAGEVILRGNVDSSGKNAPLPANANNIQISSNFDTTVSGNIKSGNATGTSGNVSLSSTHGFISVGGSVNTNSTAAATAGSAGGNVTINAADGVSIGKGVSTTGRVGGAVDIESLDGLVAINAGGVNSSALDVSDVGGGNGGNIILGNGAAGVSIVGNIVSDGGSTTASSTNGGTAGSIAIDGLGGTQAGFFSTTGFISAVGGNSKTGTGGDGNTIDLHYSTDQIGGIGPGSASINSSGGTGATAGNAKNITIFSNGIQPIPTDFNLPSTVQTMPVLPGAFFAFGNAAVNGVKGAIVAGTDVISPGTNGAESVQNPTVTQGKITVTATGADSASVTLGTGGSAISQPFNTLVDSTNLKPTSVRGLATPGEALVMYQQTHGAFQNFGLTPAGAVADTDLLGTPGTINVIELLGYDVARPFTTFNVATGVTGNESLIQVNIFSVDASNTDSIIVNLPKSATITGQFGEFDSVASNNNPKWFRINAPGTLTVNPIIPLSSPVEGGQLYTSPICTMDIRASNFVVKGDVTGKDILTRNEAGPVTVTVTDGSSILATNRLIFSAANGTMLNSPLKIVAPTSLSEAAVLSGNIEVYGSTVAVGTFNPSSFATTGPEYNGTSGVFVAGGAKTTMLLCSADVMNFGAGTLAAGTNLTISANNNEVFTSSKIFAGGNALISTSGGGSGGNLAKATFTNADVFGATLLHVDVDNLADTAGSTNTFNSNVDVKLFVGFSNPSGPGFALNQGINDVSAGRNVEIQCFDNPVSISGSISAGTPSTRAPATVGSTAGYLKSLVKTGGSISITGFKDNGANDAVAIGDNSVLSTLGGNINMLAGAGKGIAVTSIGDMTLGNQSSFNATGGNISISATGNVTGGTPSGSIPSNTFFAQAFTTGSGGGIAVQAGTAGTTLTTALAHRTTLAGLLTPSALVSTSSTTPVVVTFGTLDGGTKGTVDFSGNTNVINVPVVNPPTTVFFVKGVVLVNGLGASNITLNQAAFTSIIPTGAETRESDDFIVNADED